MNRAVAILLAVAFGGTLAAAPASRVISAEVKIVKKDGRDWCVLDSTVVAEAPLPVAALASVIEDYDAYPRLFSRIREAKAERAEGAVLLTEKVVVSVMGIENINRFTLRIARTTEGRQTRYSWTQAWTDGSIDGLIGHWLLEEVGTSDRPVTRVTYRTRSEVPVRVFGQDSLLKMFLGGETRAVVDAVVKTALTR